MPSPDDASLQCRCGQTLDLTGATPGRVGRCPRCGARFRVAATPPPPAETRGDADDDEPGGYALAPEADAPRRPAAPFVRDLPDAPERPEPRPRPSRRPRPSPDEVRPDGPRAPIQAVGRGGLFPLPKLPEDTLAGSFRYPLWDGLGLALLILVAPVMTVLSGIVFFLVPMVGQGGVGLIVGPITFGFIGIAAIALGWLLDVLSAVLVASAQGEIHHPRWPDLELGRMVGALVRWAAAWAVPGALIWYASRPWADALAGSLVAQAGLVLLATPALAYGLVALLSVSMHDEALAASPHIVLPAVVAMGRPIIGPTLALAGSILAVMGAVAAIRDGRLAPLLLLYLTWVGGLYLALVVMRATGRAYQLRARDVGWFHREPRRVEVADEALAPPDPDAYQGPIA